MLRKKMMDLFRRHCEGADILDDDNEHAMMAWCTSLGVDDYLNVSESISCTAGSEILLPKRKTANLDS
jgi:hypothetical protein